MYDVFLSYDHRDKDFVKPLAVYLERRASLNPFLDAWDLVPGEPFSGKLEEALLNSRMAAFFFGKHGGSYWVKEELEQAHQLAVQSDNEFRLLPVLLPGGSVDDIPLRLKGRTWVDFSNSGIQDEVQLNLLVAGIKGFAPRSAAAVEYADGRLAFTSKPPRKQSRRVLAFLCDRRPQTDQVVDVLDVGEEVKSTPPLLFVIEGGEDQGHEYFVRRLVEHTLPTSLGLSPNSKFVCDNFIELPHEFSTQQAFERRLQQRIGESLGLRRTASKEEIAKKICSHNGPYLVWTDFFADDWHKQGAERINAFVRYWREWPAQPAGQTLVVCLCVRYERRPTDWLGKFRGLLGGSAKVERSLKQLVTSVSEDEKLIPLQELGNVMPIHITDWSKLDLVKREYPGLHLDARIGELIQDRAGVAMKPAVAKIEQLLNSHADGGSVS